jgi:hypothetical protein
MGLHYRRGSALSTPRSGRGRGAPRKPPPAPASRPSAIGSQWRLFEQLARDYTRTGPNPGAQVSPWLAWAKYLAHRFAETRGWGRNIGFAVNRGLAIALTGYIEGDVIRQSEIFAPLRALDIPVGHTVTVLQEMGIFLDDSTPSFERWLTERLAGLAPGIRTEAERWTRVLRDGGTRSAPRQPGTVWLYLNRVRPALLDWSARYDHLREVTREDIVTHLKTLQGRPRRDQLIALRALFAWAKRAGLVFRDPTSRIKVGQYEYGVLQPLAPDQVKRSVATAATPGARLILALGRSPRRPRLPDRQPPARRPRHRQPPTHDRRTSAPPRRAHHDAADDMARSSTHTLAEHGQPPPADQQPDRHADQPCQQPLDQRIPARAGRDA